MHLILDTPSTEYTWPIFLNVKCLRISLCNYDNEILSLLLSSAWLLSLSLLLLLLLLLLSLFYMLQNGERHGSFLDPFH